jgi:hypothetical protein
MRITVRGWSRDVGETEIMSAAVADAKDSEDTDGRLSRSTLYKKVLHADDRLRTKVQVYSSVDVRLGGTYLLRLELSRKEIAQLFYETHSGSMVRMLRAFIDEEDNEDRIQQLAEFARRDERRRQRWAEMEQRESGDNTAS